MNTFSKASVQNTQSFILREKVRLNPRLACRSGVTFYKFAQFNFRHSKFRGATIQADYELWKYPHDGLIKVFQSRKMDAHLTAELLLVD